MTPLTVAVPDATLSADIDGWQDGAEYNLRVVQDSPGQFTALSGEVAEPEMADEEVETMEEGDTGGMMGGKTPAVAVVVASGRQKKSS